MKPTRSFTAFLLAISFSMGAVARGSTLYWDGAATTVNSQSDNATTTAQNWLSGGNWDNGTTSAPVTSWTSGDAAVFGGTAASETVTAGTLTAGNLTFGGGTDGSGTSGTAYNVTGGTVTLSSSTLTTNTATTISSILAGSTGLTKAGNASLTLSGANTYTGTTTINAGGVVVLDSGSIASGSGISIGSAGALTYTGLGATISNAISGSGSLTFTPTDSSAYRLFTLSGSKSGFTGVVNINAGALAYVSSGPNFFGSTTTFNVATGGQLTLDNNQSYNGNFVISGGGISGNGAIFGNGHGALTMYVSTIAGTITLSGDASLQAGNAGAASTISATVNTAGHALSFVNNTISSGAMTVTGAVGGAGSVIVNQGSTGALTVTLSSASNSYTGNTTLTTGTLALGANNVIPNGSGFGDLILTGGTLNVNGKTETVNGLSGAGAINGGGALTVGDNNATSTYSGVMSSALSLTKTGTGNLTFTGGNTYTGATTVSNGSLLLNAGSLAAGSAVSVGSTGNFGGKGSAGAVSVSAGGAVQGGIANVGNLTLSSLSFGGSASLNLMPVTGSTASVAVTGAVTTSGTQTINITSSAPLAPGAYRLVSYGSGLLGGSGISAFTLGTTPPAPGGSRPRTYTLDTTTSPLTYLGLNVSGGAPLWSGGNNGNWDTTTTGNWVLVSDGTTPTTYFTSDAVQFGNTTGNRNLVISGADVIPASVTFANDTGNDYTLTGSNGIAGIAALSKSGTGTLTIANTNSYSGGTTVTGGTLQLGNGTTNASIVGNIVDTANVTFNNGSAQTYSGVISGTGGTLTKIGSGTLTLSAANTYTGSTTINGGGLTIVTGGSISGSSPVSIGSGGTLTNTLLGGTIANSISGSGIVNLSPSDSTTVRAFPLTGNNSSFTGTVNYNVGAFSDIGTQTMLPAAGSTINVAPGGQLLINNGMNYAGNLILSGAGITTAANPPGNGRGALALYQCTISGTVTLAGDAALQAGNAGAASTISAPVNTAGHVVSFINGTGVSGAITVTGPISGSGSLVCAGGTAGGAFTLTLSSASNSYTGGTTVSSGTLTLGANNVIPNGSGFGDLTVNGTLAVNGKTATVNGLTGTGSISGSGTLTVGNNNATSSFGGVVSGTVGLVKTGTGTETLTAVNSTTQSMAVNGGTLFVNSGASIGNGGVAVNSTGTLSGIGAIFGPVTVNNLGVLTPGGSSIGTLSVYNTVTFQTGSKVTFQINKTASDPTPLTSDLLYVNAVNFGGTLEVTATGDALDVGDSFQLFSSPTSSGGFSSYILPTLPAGLSWDLSGLLTSGTITVVNTLNTPIFSLAPGTYTGAQSLAITSNTGSTIHYTLDGTDPHTSGTRINVANPASGILLNPPSTTTIRAYAEMSGFADSDETSGDYTIVAQGVWITAGDGSWEDPSNWQDNAVGNGTGITADFSTLDLPGDATVTLVSPHTIGKLIFGDTTPDSNWIVSGFAPLTLDAAVPTIQVVNQTATYNGVLTGINGLTKTGAGMLILNGTNTYGGATTISAGTVIAKTTGTIPTGSTVSLGDTAANASLLLDLPNSSNFSSPITVPGTGTGTATFGWVPQATTTGGNNPVISGNITLAGRTLVLQNGVTNDFGNRLDYTGVISGTGNITINGVGVGKKLLMTGSSANTWVGGLTITAGSFLQLSNGGFSGVNFLPDGTSVTVDGTLINAKNGTNETIGTLSGSGSLSGYSTGGANTWTVGSGDGSSTFSGVISNGTGVLNFTKIGTGTQTLSGANTYTGTTTVSAGTLALATTGSLAFVPTTNGVTNKVTGAGTATFNGAFTINLAGANTTSGNTWTLVDVTSKTYGGSFAVTGFTGASHVWTKVTGGNTWTFTEATGILSVGPGNTYASWATTNAGGGTADQDYDHDGVPNGVEYFMGLTGSSFTLNPAPDATGKITWPKDPAATATYVVQTSADLVTWTTATTGVVDNGTSVQYTIPTGDPKRFVRLKVTIP